jgi:pimeloyl-ACP methyl ester carboxylesterase
VVVVCNSVGGVAGLQVCKQRPDLVQGVMCINISLRMLHAKKQVFPRLTTTPGIHGRFIGLLSALRSRMSSLL